MRLSRLDTAVLLVAVLVVGTLLLTLALVRPPTAPLRVVYLAPATGSPQNLWVLDPAQPDEPPRQLTFTPFGVFDFAPSPDGRYIAYAERMGADQNFRVELMLLDVFDGSVQRLTQCAAEDANCTTPAWRPDGRQLAYMRSNAGLSNDGSLAPSKIWLMDEPLSAARQTYPLFNDNQTTGSGPIYSADGRRIAFYENIGRGVLVFDFNPPSEADRLKFIPADNGATGSLSPDGQQLITSILIVDGDRVRSGLIVADVVNNTTRPLLPDGESSDGSSAAWHPDGQHVAILRQYQDEARFTVGHQIYQVELATNTLTPLLVDERYTHGSMAYSPQGDLLLLQRYQLGTSAPGVWLLDLATGQPRQLVSDAYLPAWLPAVTGDS